jgi:hypothetical protein
MPHDLHDRRHARQQPDRLACSRSYSFREEYPPPPFRKRSRPRWLLSRRGLKRPLRGTCRPVRVGRRTLTVPTLSTTAAARRASSCAPSPLGCSGGRHSCTPLSNPPGALSKERKPGRASPKRSRAGPQTSSGSTSPGSRRCRIGKPHGSSRSRGRGCRHFPHRRSPHVQSRQ